MQCVHAEIIHAYATNDNPTFQTSSPHYKLTLQACIEDMDADTGTQAQVSPSLTMILDLLVGIEQSLWLLELLALSSSNK